jgi:hypothetical protein
MFLIKSCISFAHKNLKKPPQKVAYLWQLRVFFSAAPTAQNSPELHFRFINSFIPPSLVGSLLLYMKKDQMYNRKLFLSIEYLESGDGLI